MPSESSAAKSAWDDAPYRALFDQATIGVVELEECGTIRRVNPRFRQLVDDPSRVEFAGLSFPLFLAGEARAEVERAIARLTDPDAEDQSIVVRSESLLLRPLHAILTLCSLRSSAGKGNGLLVLVEDVSKFENERRTLAGELAAERERGTVQAEELHRLLEEVVDAERRARERLARNLHGALQQQLLAVLMHLPTRAPVALEAIDEVRALVLKAVELSRSLASDLRPEMLEEQGLLPALAWLAEESGRKNGLTVHLDLDARSEPGSKTARFVLFEVVRELLVNVVKHAQASSARLEVLLDGSADGVERLRIVVRDDGKGFDLERLRVAERSQSGLGLWDVHHRVAALGGRIRFDTAPGKGTVVTIDAPLNGPHTRIRASRGGVSPRREAPVDAGSGDWDATASS